MNNYEISDALTGEFEFVAQMKKGGQSELILLYDKVCRRKAVLKSGRNDLIENEARIMSKFFGKGIPEVYCCFERGGVTYLLKQYIAGSSLREIITENGPFSPEKAAAIGAAVCETVSRLHNADPPVIHRDIKSDNIVMNQNGEIYIIDFGISREYDPYASRDTQVMGTPVTAPPEQFGYGQTDERSDIYAIGALVNELATGSPERGRVKLPRRLEKIVRRCMEFSPEKRFRNVRECQSALLGIQKRSFKLPAAVGALVLSAAALALAFNIGLQTGKDISVPVTADNGYGESGVISKNTEDNENNGKQVIEFEGVYPGDWKYIYGIPKSTLEAFGGNVRVKLEVETIREGKDGDYCLLVPADADNKWVYPEILTDNNRGEDGKWIALGRGQETCTFEIPQDVIASLGKNGIDFQLYNVIIKSAVLEKAFDTKTPYTAELDSEYRGDYALSSTIPLSVLKNYKGDIKVTLKTKVGRRYSYANFIPIALAGEDGVWVELKDEISCTEPRNEDGFIELANGQTECTIIISHDAVETAGEQGIGFRAVNITFTSAELSDAV